jgi:phage-related minor tail protein
LFNLGQSLKQVKRDGEDAAMNFLPDTAINQVSKNIKRIERESEDLPSKYRDIEVTIQRSLTGAEFSKFIGTQAFRDTDAVKKFANELKSLGVTETQVQAILDAGTQSREALSAAIDNLSAATKSAIARQAQFLNLELQIQEAFGNRKAVLQGQSNALSAFGLPTRSVDIAQKKLSIDEDITRQEYAYADAVENQNAAGIQKSLQQIDLLKQQKVAYQDLIPGVVTYGEAVQIAFQPAVDSFYDFITGAKSAKEAFRSFAYEVVSSLAKMAAQAAIMQVFKGIFSSFGLGGLFGGGGGFLGLANGGIASGGFQAFANGGIADGGIKFKAFASGGTVSGPTLGLIGEGRYNEAVVPLPDGKSIPVSIKGGGGSGEAININIAVDATGSKVQGDEGGAGKLASAISAAVQSELVKQKRPGGLLA